MLTLGPTHAWNQRLTCGIAPAIVHSHEDANYPSEATTFQRRDVRPYGSPDCHCVGFQMSAGFIGPVFDSPSDDCATLYARRLSLAIALHATESSVYSFHVGGPLGSQRYANGFHGGGEVTLAELEEVASSGRDMMLASEGLDFIGPVTGDHFFHAETWVATVPGGFVYASDELALRAAIGVACDVWEGYAIDCIRPNSKQMVCLGERGLTVVCLDPSVPEDERPTQPYLRAAKVYSV